MTLKRSVRLRLHIFRVLKYPPGREAVAAAHGFTDLTPADCAGFRDQSVHGAEDLGRLWKFHSPAPTVLVLLTPNSISRQVLSLSSGESVLESFNCLSHHRGNFCEKRNKAVVSDPQQFRHTKQCFTTKAEVSPLLVLHHQKNGCKWKLSANTTT